MNARVVVTMAVLAGTAVLIGQLRAGAGPKGPQSETAPPTALAAGGAAAGGCPSPSIGPDVIVSNLTGIVKYGTFGGITGYAIGTTSCNIGDAPLQWVAGTNNHPVIAQNFYRFYDGRFEQLGMSWLKHGFAAVNGSECCQCEDPGTYTLLGVGCSDPYGAGLNGDQDGLTGCGGICGGLGPRYEVNATTGVYPYPYATLGQPGNALYKRLDIHNDDLDPALNPGARFYAEGQYVSPDDAAACNLHNNATYKRVVLGTFDGEGWFLNTVSPVHQELAAIHAWKDEDPQVLIEPVDDGDGGRFNLGYRVTDNGDGTWHYEYALHNQNSHRSAMGFSVPTSDAVTVTGIGFHDVDYHSNDGVASDGTPGVNYDGTDWPVAVGSGTVSWSTESAAANLNANALRWGTLYNFRFDADAAPGWTTATIDLYRSGSPASVTAQILGPDTCPWDMNDDGFVVVDEMLDVFAAWNTAAIGPPDLTGDGFVGVDDFLEVFSHWGLCPGLGPCGDPFAGNCYEANGTPACSTSTCCNAVCAIDPACCDTAWDAGCAALAILDCTDCGTPAAGDCCSPNGTPSCNDASCCATVCAIDSYCCNFAWDILCADTAHDYCGICP